MPSCPRQSPPSLRWLRARSDRGRYEGCPACRRRADSYPWDPQSHSRRGEVASGLRSLHANRPRAALTGAEGDAGPGWGRPRAHRPRTVRVRCRTSRLARLVAPAGSGVSSALCRLRRQSSQGWLPGRGASALAFDPAQHLLFQKIERHRSATQELIVEGAEVPLRAQLGLRLPTQREEPELSNLVGQSLPWPADVTIGSRPGCTTHPSPCAVGSSRPSAAGSSACCARRCRGPGGPSAPFRWSAVRSRSRVLVQTDFLAQSLGVQRPAFHKGGVGGVLAVGGTSFCSCASES